MDVVEHDLCKQRHVEDALVCHSRSCCESCVLRCFFSNLSSILTTSFLVLHQSEDLFLTQCVSFFCSGGVQQTFCCMAFSKSA